MSGWVHRIAVSALVIGVMACDVATVATPSPTAAELPTVVPSAGGRTLRLPTPELQRTVVQALESTGARVTTVIPSKFDWLFGNTSPMSATFQGTLDGGEEFWVDVHFLAAPLENLTACSNRASSGETEFTVSVNGQPQVFGEGSVTGYLGSAGPMFFAGSERVFVMTPHARALDVLRGPLAVSPPRC